MLQLKGELSGVALPTLCLLILIINLEISAHSNLNVIIMYTCTSTFFYPSKDLSKQLYNTVLFTYGTIYTTNKQFTSLLPYVHIH